MAELLKNVDNLVWGPGMLVLLLGTGIYLMIRMRFLPLRNLGYAIRCLFQKEESDGQEGEVSALASLTTELAATIGTGNIVGVATAMVMGGPGALIWMIFSALIGLSTKFAESMLAVKYRAKNESGTVTGGPMYTLQSAFPNKKAGSILAMLFALFAVLSSFGMGNMAQSNSITMALAESFDIPQAKSGLVVTILVILVILGGIRSISKITLYMVPCMALFYIIGALAVIIANPDGLAEGVIEIVTMAFSTRAMAGGVSGAIVASMQDALRLGVSRGVFSNEAGLGAAGISAAAANTASPVRQGYISMTGIFFDTIVICTLTGLALAASGVLGMTDENGALLTGAALTIEAFSTVFGEFGGSFVSIGIVLFAFATIIAWEYQGERAFEFLMRNPRYNAWYRLVYTLITFVGSVCALEPVWSFSDIMNALMAIPNLIGILALSGEVCSEMRSYEDAKKR